MSTEAVEATTTPEVTEVEVEVYEDYWGTDETHHFFLPDKKQYFTIKVMAEGERARYQRMTNQDLTINRDQTAKVRMDPATERQSLIKSSVIDWNLRRNGHPVGFHASKLEEWLSKASPKIVDDLEFFIRSKNPWLQNDMTIEQINKERERLDDLEKQVRAREAGESVSATK